jgi:hypothetical protein
MKLDPECYKSKNLFFIRSNGTYAPCCYTSANDQLEKFLGPDLYGQLNLTNYSYEEVTNSEAWAKIRTMIESDKPLPICEFLCAQREKGDARVDMINNIRVGFSNKMKPFNEYFKLYAYKKYDINDLSFRVNDNFVLTYRLTHDEIKQMFDGANTKDGINLQLKCGVKMYVVIKRNISAVRFTINTHGGNFNLRFTIEDFEKLISDYNFQMENRVKWDDYDPR